MTVKNSKIKKNQLPLRFIGLSILASISLSIPFLAYQLGWLVCIALIPFLYLLKQLSKFKLKRTTTIAYIWFSGWVMFLGTTFWIVQTEPDRWAGTSGWWSTGLLVLIYLLMTLILSIGFVLFGAGWSFLQLKFSQKRIFLLLPALWVVCEWARSWIFSAISKGPNTSLGMHWNFADLGFAASVTPLVFMARLVGLLGLGFAVVVMNLCIFWFIQKRWKLPMIILIIIAVSTIVSWWAYKTPDGKTVNVAALQLGTNQNLQIGSIDYHQYLKSIVSKSHTDILVLPEYSDIFNEQDLQQDKDAVSAIASNPDMPIVTSRQRTENSHTFNTVTVYRPNSTIVYQYDKQFLIPIGEAMPYALSTLMNMLGQGSNIKIREISRGTTVAQAYVADGLKLGSQACSGAISPELYRELTLNGAQMLTNSASLSIFENAPSYHSQAQQMARFMAVSNARPFVQATDGSYSFVMDNNGTWVAKSGQKNIQLLQQTVKLNSKRTIYTLLGEWVAAASIILLAVYAWIIFKR